MKSFRLAGRMKAEAAQIWRKGCKRYEADAERTRLRELFRLFGGFSPGLGGHKSRRNHHSDKGQGNQEIMHSIFPRGGFLEPVHTQIIPLKTICMNPTNTDWGWEAGGIDLTRRWEEEEVRYPLTPYRFNGERGFIVSSACASPHAILPPETPGTRAG